MQTLQAGTIVPNFTLQTAMGERFSRGDLRGKAALVIVFLPANDGLNPTYLANLSTAAQRWSHEQKAVVISAEALPPTEGLIVLRDPEAKVLAQFLGEGKGGWFITDRYGELYAQGQSLSTADLPKPMSLSEWLEYVNMRCGG